MGMYGGVGCCVGLCGLYGVYGTVRECLKQYGTVLGCRGWCGL